MDAKDGSAVKVKQPFVLEVVPTVEWSHDTWPVSRGAEGFRVAVLDRRQASWERPFIEVDHKGLDLEVEAAQRSQTTEFLINVVANEKFEWGTSEYREARVKLFAHERGSDVAVLVSTRNVSIMQRREVTVAPSVFFCDPASSEPCKLMILCRNGFQLERVEFAVPNADGVLLSSKQVNGRMMKLLLDPKEVVKHFGSRESLPLRIKTSTAEVRIDVPLIVEEHQ
ncbi:MAG: hypothetical protein Aurels2KO_56030 [Aureliella sp.]